VKNKIILQIRNGKLRTFEMVKILAVLTSHEKGYYLPEIAHPYSRFIKAGFEVTICSIEGGEGNLYH
jgi:putative intracellular protease/amidase